MYQQVDVPVQYPVILSEAVYFGGQGFLVVPRGVVNLLFNGVQQDRRFHTGTGCYRIGSGGGTGCFPGCFPLPGISRFLFLFAEEVPETVFLLFAGLCGRSFFPAGVLFFILRHHGRYFLVNDFPGIRHVSQQLQQGCHLCFFFYQQITYGIYARPLHPVPLSSFQVLEQGDCCPAFLLVGGIVFFRPSGNQLPGGGKVQQAEESPVGLLPFSLPVRFLPFHRASLLPTVVDDTDYQNRKGYPYQVSGNNLQFQSCLYHPKFVL